MATRYRESAGTKLERWILGIIAGVSVCAVGWAINAQLTMGEVLAHTKAHTASSKLSNAKLDGLSSRVTVLETTATATEPARIERINKLSKKVDELGNKIADLTVEVKLGLKK